MLGYADPQPEVWDDPLRRTYANGLFVALVGAAVGLALAILYAAHFERVHRVPASILDLAGGVAFWMGLGAVLRLVSEPAGAVLQATGLIARDNCLVLAAEVAWVVATALLASPLFESDVLMGAALGYAASGLLLLLLRANEAGRETSLHLPPPRLLDPVLVKRLLGTGGLIAAAQFADFLYAPVDYILINWLMSPGAVAAYAPVVQINGGLLLLVGGLAAVLLPRAAVAHVGGDADTLRRYYVRGTLAAGGMLAAAGLAVWALSPWVFRLWLGDPLPAAQAVLPLVLVHTVLGGSGGVGRSILLAAGKAKPYAAAVLLTGVSHVALSYAFVRYFRWGLQGIALGTVAAAVGLCVVWQPWYVLRTLRQLESGGATDAARSVTPTGFAPSSAEPL